MSEWVDVYLGLGANQGDPQGQLRQAIIEIEKIANTRAHQCSAFYGSKPMGPQDQPDYVNAVLYMQCALTAHELLDATQAIELALGRVRKEERWGPRTLDIDIVLFGSEIINDERLIVPHYGMKEREFVLYPLYELTPELVLPDGCVLKDLKEAVPHRDLQQL